jgi:hypothetical protein
MKLRMAMTGKASDAKAADGDAPGLPSKSTSAVWMLGLLTPRDVRSSFMATGYPGNQPFGWTTQRTLRLGPL